MRDQLVGNVRSMLWMLVGAVGFVLLIACANMANLLLARAASCSREFAVRSALGAMRARLIGQLLAESVLLSSAGGVLGILLAVWSLRAISKMTAFELPRSGEIHLDWMVLLFAAVLSIGTGVLFGLVPSLAMSRPDLISMLRASGEIANQGDQNLENTVWSETVYVSFAQNPQLSAMLAIRTAGDPRRFVNRRYTGGGLNHDQGIR